MSACSFIGAGHPFESAMDRIRADLASAPRPATARPAPRRVVRQHELKGVRDAGGGWKLDRFYASTLAWGGEGPLPFRAVTYHWSGKTGAGSWFEFPRDPYLAALDHLAAAEDVEVLQYVVLRRLTYRARAADGATRIGKFKRRSRARGAFDALASVSAAAAREGISFRVPAALSHDDARNLFHQEVLPGAPVSELVDDGTLEPLLHGVGRVHAELHGLAVPGVPVADERAPLEQLARECDWVSFFRPADRRRLDAVRDVLLQVAPRLAGVAPALCHGDFVCSHVLRAPEGWGVVDFDLVHLGDPHADAATLLSSMTNDVPYLHGAWRDPARAAQPLMERSLRAYVEGYHSHGGRLLDPRRLLWHRVAAEIHMLALMFTKDRFHPLAFERSMDLVERMTVELSRAGGERA